MARLRWRSDSRGGWPGAPDRPTLFSVVFWIVLVATVAGYIVRPDDTLHSVLFAINVVAVASLWLVLPWKPAPGHQFTALLFLPATFALGLTGSYGTHMLLTLIGIANLAFVYGMRTASAILGGMSVAIFVMALLFGRTVLDALTQVGAMAVFAAFVLGMTSAVLEARLRRAEAQGLLDRVRELAVAQERARMGGEMHDSIGHYLTVIKVGLENAERYRERRPEMAWDEVRQAKEVTRDALSDARRWVRALRPLALDGRVGSAALERLAASFDGTGLTVAFEVEGRERLLEPDVELVLYRVLQEGLTNALRHAEARHVRGRLTFGDDRVTLVITDDGKGQDHGGDGGFGLTSLAERTRALSGELTGGSAAGGGFELRAEVPTATRAPGSEPAATRRGLRLPPLRRKRRDDEPGGVVRERPETDIRAGVRPI
ncbi:sensor histidine kinase [Spongiactinospora sp. TRM90649]|uniref:sensor histidine kinase n=1 Tax=Spongiactinospora sp. TRM90649 TaxID=3031114 RepID=UPI0023F98B81|nr:sensor histidine kinase [Spongiactinospora sp. TRM90649]MDF5752409.1 sensor histidine kinase [Spongiactinospora sp. TRM90649]